MSPVIDIHFHLLADNDIDGCKMSDRLKGSAPGLVAGVLTGTTLQEFLDLIDPDDEPHESSSHLARKLLRLIDTADHVDGAVLLALDCIVDHAGNEKLEDSHLVVTNRYAAQVVRAYRGSKLLRFGASVHPYRPDALERLDQAIADGAVLVKWVPSSQQFDLEDPRAIAFGQHLAERGIPLLCHMGKEGAIPVPDASFREQENPGKLKKILDTGAKVIVAHCAAPYTEEEPNYVPTIRELLANPSWDVLVDISALLLGPIRGCALRGFFDEVPASKMVYGSDFPIPTLDLSFGMLERAIELKYYLHAAATRNWLDIDVLYKRAYRIPDAVFTNTARVLGIEGARASTSSGQGSLPRWVTNG